jgi:hypothetical protein
MVMRHMVLGNMNYSAGEDLQQFSSLLVTNNGTVAVIKVQTVVMYAYVERERAI